MTSTSDSDLIASVHEGALETPSWSKFLSLLRDRCRADYAGIIFRSDAQKFRLTELASGIKITDELRQRYLDEFHMLDPVPHHLLRPNRVYALEEFLDPRNPEHERFRREFMAEAMTGHSRIVRVVEPGGLEAWLAIARTRTDFGADAAAVLSSLTRHFAIALRTFAAIEKGQLRADISAGAIQKLNFGWIALDAAGMIIETDAQADRIIRETQALHRSASGRLVPPTRAAQATLTKLLNQTASGLSVKPTAIHLCDDPWLDMLVTPISYAPFPRGNQPVLVAYIHGEIQTGQDRHEHLAALFGLTRQEAKLALAISRGRSLAEAAIDLGITVETCRLYSKRIYSKTGTRGQADLVRLILASVVSMI